MFLKPKALNWFADNRGGVMSSLYSHCASWQIVHVPVCRCTLDIFHRAYYAGLLPALTWRIALTPSKCHVAKCVKRVPAPRESIYTTAAGMKSGNIPSAERCDRKTERRIFSTKFSCSNWSCSRTWKTETPRQSKWKQRVKGSLLWSFSTNPEHCCYQQGCKSTPCWRN